MALPHEQLSLQSLRPVKYNNLQNLIQKIMINM